MKQTIQDIFQLEDSEAFDEAFEAYNEIYSKNKGNYEIWKYFYFFLWTAIEDAPSSFNERINLRNLLQVMLDEGKQMFSEKADFNFIAGYTVSIFPYEYGEYDDLEKEAKQMLVKAIKLEPDNIIYKMVYLGSISKPDDHVYMQTVNEAAPTVLGTFSGNGALNNYFREVLYRIDKKT